MLSSITNRIDLDRPAVPVADALVLSLAAALWLVLLEGGLPGLGPAPAGLDAPMAAPGVPEAMAVANGLSGGSAYLLMWGTMMVAMMLPSLVPVVRRYRERLCCARNVFAPAIASFLLAYGLVWTAVGVVPLAVESTVSIHGLVSGSVLGVDASALVVGGLLAFAGAYQFSPLKRDLLARCASCRQVPHRPSVGRMGREGVAYAVNCVGCTWPLFAAMVALGSMNVTVMVGLMFVVVLERVAPESENVARAWGVVLLGAAAFTLLFGVPSV